MVVFNRRWLRAIALLLATLGGLGVWLCLMQQLWLIQILSPVICPGATYSIPTKQPSKQPLEKPLVALTIDDGPATVPFPTGENSTAQLLQLLSEHQVHATFFLISSQVQQRESSPGGLNPLVAQMVRDGHELGNHMTQDEPSIQLGDRFQTELRAAQQVLDRYARQTWMRPGGGWCTSNMKAIAAQNGYQVALGSVWPYDTAIPSAAFATWFIRQNVRPGAVIVLHDSGPNAAWGQRTYQTLERVLPYLKSHFQVVTLSELMRHQADPTNASRM